LEFVELLDVVMGLELGASFDPVRAGAFEADGATGDEGDGAVAFVGVVFVEDALGFFSDGSVELVAVEWDEIFVGLVGVVDDFGEGLEESEGGFESDVVGEGGLAAGCGEEALGDEVEGAGEVEEDAVAEGGEGFFLRR
jgi:hypothetical protein